MGEGRDDEWIESKRGGINIKKKKAKMIKRILPVYTVLEQGDLASKVIFFSKFIPGLIEGAEHCTSNHALLGTRIDRNLAKY